MLKAGCNTGGIGYMRNVVLVLVAAVIVQLLENYLKSKKPALYEKLGFTQVGLRKNYYRNPKEDALILRKEWNI